MTEAKHTGWNSRDNCVYDDGMIAECDSEERAAQIVREHNAFSALVEACDLAEQTLEQAFPDPANRGIVDAVLFALKAALLLAKGGGQ